MRNLKITGNKPVQKPKRTNSKIETNVVMSRQQRGTVDSLNEKRLALSRGSNAPKGTTVGVNKAGQEVYYKPGYSPTLLGKTEGPTSLNKKGMQKVGKVSRLNKRINKIEGKRDVLSTASKDFVKKFNKLTTKREKLVTKKNKYFE